MTAYTFTANDWARVNRGGAARQEWVAEMREQGNDEMLGLLDDPKIARAIEYAFFVGWLRGHEGDDR